MPERPAQRHVWTLLSNAGLVGLGTPQASCVTEACIIMECCLDSCVQVKNDTARLEASLGANRFLKELRGRRTLPSFASEVEHASLGAIAARHGPSSIFALQRQARLEAQKAYVHVDCSRRVQKALLFLSIENFR